MRKKWGAPKKKFGAPIWCSYWCGSARNGSKWGEPKKNFGPLLGLPREPKFFFGSL